MCAGCHQKFEGLPYAMAAQEVFCSRRCLRAWMAAHPEPDDEEVYE